MTMLSGGAGQAVRDTIAALASPAGRGGIGIVRVSGSAVPRIASAVCGVLPPERQATFTVFRGRGGEILDQGIALYFVAPRSYTGEDVLELQGHGGPVVMQALLGACLDAGARLAEPGEFTRRAFLEGKLDLAQAEAVADLIDAASGEAARSALRSLQGEFSAAIEALRGRLMELRTLVEAMLDFPEENLEVMHRRDAAQRLVEARATLDGILARSRQGSLLRSGVQVVLAGRPNVGKSSLLNRLAGAERAIVTAFAGTTRDALRELIQIEGVPISVVDTAGLRESVDEIERMGMARTRLELAQADVVLVILDAVTGLVAEDMPILAEVPEGAHCIQVFNKVDLVSRGAAGAGEGGLYVSALTGAGFDALRREILARAGWMSGGESVFLARERHLRALGRTQVHLAEAANRLSEWELFAEELRLAQDSLGSITGETSADDLLGEIFGRFCIGK